MPYEQASRKHSRALDVAVSRLPPRNAAPIKAFLERERLGDKSSATLAQAADYLGRLARFIHDAPLASVTPAQLDAFFSDLSQSSGPTTLHLAAGKIRRFLRAVTPRAGFEELEPHTRVGRRGQKQLRVPITEAERDALLAAASDDLQTQAILWALWDTGMRASELVGLNVGSLEPDDGGAYLTLPADGQDFKTGARRIYVVDCVGALQAWRSAHPLAGDPLAPLFLGFRGRHHHGRLWPNTINDKLRRLCRDAGLRHVNPHLFRHTRATRAARENWSAGKANAFFGWAPGSTEWATYEHLRDSDVRDQVRRDAGLDGLGRLAQADPRAALRAAVAAAVAETLRSVGLARP